MIDHTSSKIFNTHVHLYRPLVVLLILLCVYVAPAQEMELVSTDAMFNGDELYFGDLEFSADCKYVCYVIANTNVHTIYMAEVNDSGDFININSIASQAQRPYPSWGRSANEQYVVYFNDNNDFTRYRPGDAEPEVIQIPENKPVLKYCRWFPYASQTDDSNQAFVMYQMRLQGAISLYCVNLAEGADAERHLVSDNAMNNAFGKWIQDEPRFAFVKDNDIYTFDATDGTQKQVTNTPDIWEVDNFAIAFNGSTYHIASKVMESTLVYREESSATEDIYNTINFDPANTSHSEPGLLQSVEPFVFADNLWFAFSLHDSSEVKLGEAGMPAKLPGEIWLANIDSSVALRIAGDEQGTATKLARVEPEIVTKGKFVYIYYLEGLPEEQHGDTPRVLQRATLQLPSVVIGETGQVTANHEWVVVELEHDYVDPVVVVNMVTYNGNHPSTLRVRNVTANSFECQVDEWDYLDGNHAVEDIHYMVVEAGDHMLEDGTHIQAGIANVSSANATIPFLTNFAGTPVLVSQATSTNDVKACVTRQKDITTSSFNIRLQSQEADGKTHGAESVAWIAYHGPDMVLNADDQTESWAENTFSTSYAETPIVLAAMQTFDGGDSAGLRCRTLTTSTISTMVEEEKSLDDEIGHTTEQVGLIVLPAGAIISAPLVLMSGNG